MYFDSQLWALTRGIRWRFFICAMLGLLALGTGIARFAFLGQFLARMFASAPVDELLQPLAGVAVVVVLRAAFEHALNCLCDRNAARIQEALRARLYDKIVELGPAWFGNERTGGVMLAVVDGVEQLQTFFGRYIPQLFIAACAPVIIFLFIAWWDWPVALVLLCAALATLVLPLLFHRSHQLASQARQKSFKMFGEEFLDAIQGLPTLKSFGQSRVWGKRLAERARSLSDNTFKVLGKEVSSRLITDIGITVGAAAALSLGAWRVADGEMTLAALLVVLMAGTEIFRPLRDLRAVLHQGMVGQSAAQSVRALLDSVSDAPKVDGVGGAQFPTRVTGGLGIEFDKVSFSYRGGRGAVHTGLSFVVEPGQRVAIVGPSGSGKSTVARLLLRLHNLQAGSVKLGGVDLREYDLKALRRQVALVAQDSMLFHGTVEENLLLGRSDATPDQMVAAARWANAHDFIMELPQGYQTVLGERGAQLSGGQRQRLAIARALVRDAPVLILDEALSSVDAENEADIQQALDRLSQGRTTLVLAHRLSSVIGADHILVLHEGHITESGTHGELLARNGMYRRLMGAQAQAMGRGSGHAGEPLADRGGAARKDGPALRELGADASQVGMGRAFATLREIIKPWRRSFAVVVASGVGRVAAFIGVSVLSALVVVRLKNGEPFGDLLIALFASAIAAGVLHWIESWLAHSIAYQLLAELRIALYDKLETLAPAYLLERRSGDLLGLATQDVETIEYFFAHTVAPAFVAVLVPAVVVLTLGLTAWPLVFALLPFLLWAAWSPLAGRKRIDHLGSEARQALGEVNAHLTETIQGLSDLVAFAATERRRGSFLSTVRKYQALRLKLLGDLSRQTVLLEIATGLGGLSVAVMGAWLVMQGYLAAEFLPLLILLSTAAFLPISEIAQVGRQLADTMASAQRLRVVHDEPLRITGGSLCPELKTSGLPLQFNRLGFTYSGREERALDEISLRVDAGATIALVGPSGAGKTTLASLLMRFWDPTHGSIEIDGTDLRLLTLDALYSRIALVAQDTWLLNGTIEDNIRLAKPDAASGQLTRALEQSALDDFITQLPDGLATRVGERGVALSGGQRQRIAIARAFLRDAPILILDEATSHLDAISEEQVHRALAALMQHRTTLIIAHRLSTIQQADAIAVMNHGRIAEFGTHAQLMQKQGFYARLVD
ncbi:MAG: ABC transporter ATP-binding protein, partial [Paralcaligenes sp.]